MDNARVLDGITVAVTRPRDRADTLSEALEDRGAGVVLLPAFRIEANEAGVTAARNAVAAADWIVFSSANAVESVAGILAGMRPRVAVVGPATAAAVRRAGGDVAMVASPHSGDGLIATLVRDGIAVEGRRVLFPCGEEALDTIPRGLAGLGAEVDRIEVYRTVPEAPSLPEQTTRIDAVTFASPTAVRYFADIAGAQLDAIRSTAVAAVIGPTTAHAAEEHSWPNVITANEHTTEGLVAVIVQHFSRER